MESPPTTSLDAAKYSSSYPQQVFNRILEENLRGRYQLEHVEEAKSAQQEVYILRLSATNDDSQDGNPDAPAVGTHGGSSGATHVPPRPPRLTQDWLDALHSGRHHLVVRIWKGGCRWWNLHRNSSPLGLADAEAMGYRVAGTVFSTTTKGLPGVDADPSGNANKTRRLHNSVVVPRLLHFEPGSMNATAASSTNESLPWAVLEYVGPESRHFVHSQDDDENGNYAHGDNVVDNRYLDGMISVRFEYGFEEPHPRWGRVPVDQALEYAQIVLQQVVIPLHRLTGLLWTGENQHDRDASSVVCTPRQHVYSYSTMVKLYRDAWKDMIVETNATDGAHGLGTDPRISRSLKVLDEALVVLEANSASICDHAGQQTTIPSLSPVLVHMDLQPQNLIFRARKAYRPSGDGDSNSQGHQSGHGQLEGPSSTVFAVLDWEDAAWADPRFDLLLLCRKVCANREQANVLWSEYGATLARDSDDGMDEYPLGPIEPWLQLETVHSIATLLLQSMDLLDGGRNPWETKNDLWGKLEREFARWYGPLKHQEVITSTMAND
jgi:thiamine kinase-like enzyme